MKAAISARAAELWCWIRAKRFVRIRKLRKKTFRKFSNPTRTVPASQGKGALFMIQDFKFAFRHLLKSPGFTSVAVMTLALAIGVNSAIFAMVKATVLHPVV